jgi:hypothetical protein
MIDSHAVTCTDKYSRVTTTYFAPQNWRFSHRSTQITRDTSLFCICSLAQTWFHNQMCIRAVKETYEFWLSEFWSGKQQVLIFGAIRRNYATSNRSAPSGAITNTSSLVASLRSTTSHGIGRMLMFLGVLGCTCTYGTGTLHLVYLWCSGSESEWPSGSCASFVLNDFVTFCGNRSITSEFWEDDRSASEETTWSI